MIHHEHVWANGALVCNCGARRDPRASSSAPPGWPGVPSEPVCDAPDSPVHVSITVGQTSADPRSRIVVGGVDLTRHCRGVKVDSGVGAVTGVWLDLIGVTVDVEADVPPDRVRTFTLEQDEARREAREVPGARLGPQTPSEQQLLLVVSLGQVKG